MRLRYQDFHFLRTVLLEQRIVAFREDASRGTELDDISAVLDHFANAVHHCFRAVGNTFCGIMKFERQQVAVTVSASDAEGRAGNLHTRPDYVSGIDGVAEGHIRIAFRADVAYRSEASQQCEPRIF